MMKSKIFAAVCAFLIMLSFGALGFKDVIAKAN